MSTIKRWDMTEKGRPYRRYTVMAEDQKYGDYVLYTDHAAALAEKDEAIANLKRVSFHENVVAQDAIERAERAEAQRDALLEIVRAVERCSYLVSTDLVAKGYRWCEAYLDEVMPDIRAAIQSQENTDGN